jgi:tetratricopeptide (TPR) repeat protein
MKSFGLEHPSVAIRLNNLAGLLYQTNRPTQAEPLFELALAINEKSFGPEHPHVALSLNNLAGLLRQTNRPAQAEPLYRRALALDEQRLGPDHPDVAGYLHNLALMLHGTNRLEEAEPLSRRAVQILAEFERLTGHEHPHFHTAIDDYAGLLKAMRLSKKKVAQRVRSAIEDQPEESA